MLSLYATYAHPAHNRCPVRIRIQVEAPVSLGYTNGMKTAISLPDDLFRAAERLARRSRKSRSQLYADALSEYVARHAPDEVTEAMNAAVERVAEPTPEPFGARAARRALERTEW